MTVTAISRYPIKSLGGEALDEAAVTSAGLVGDRAYVFLDVESGRLCNAKNPRKFARLLACTARYLEPPEPGAPLPPLEVRFPDGTSAHNDSSSRNDTAALDAAMSRYLGRPVRLIDTLPEAGAQNEIVYDPWFGQERVRAYSNAVADEFGHEVVAYAQKENAAGTFVDLAPLHLVTTSTLEHFARLDPAADFDARRYRPNLVIATSETGTVEDGWVGRTARFGPSVRALVTLPTGRCVMSTLEHAADVPQDRQTLRTVVTHNSKELDGRGRWGCLGVYADVVSSGTVRLGDPVDVEEPS